MDIAKKLDVTFPDLNRHQKSVIMHDEGPLLVIAGPGSGKTQCLLLRIMNLLLLGKATPEQLILCTYTDKAAKEMYHRLLALAQQMAYQGDLAQLRVGTIHSICNQLIMENRHDAKLRQ